MVFQGAEMIYKILNIQIFFVFKTNYKLLSRIFANFNGFVIKTAMFCFDFLYFL